MMRYSYILIFSFFSLSVFGHPVTSCPLNLGEITENAPKYGTAYIQLLSPGTCSYSPLADSKGPTADDPRVVVYPNPTNASFTVKVELDKNSEIEIIVYNAIGKAIFSSREAASQGTYYKPINFSEQPAGLYFVHVKAGELKSIERLIKINQD